MDRLDAMLDALDADADAATDDGLLFADTPGHSTRSAALTVGTLLQDLQTPGTSVYNTYATDEPALPPNWEKRIRPSDGRVYYVDHEAKTTHWELPEAVRQAMAPVSASDPYSSSSAPFTQVISVQMEPFSTHTSTAGQVPTDRPVSTMEDYLSGLGKMINSFAGGASEIDYTSYVAPSPVIIETVATKKPTPSAPPHGGQHSATGKNGEVSVGQRVHCKDAHEDMGWGVIRFIGNLPALPALFVGVELDEPKGRNSGDFKGTPIFTCAPKHGIFTSADYCYPEPSGGVVLPSASSSAAVRSETLSTPSTVGWTAELEPAMDDWLDVPVMNAPVIIETTASAAAAPRKLSIGNVDDFMQSLTSSGNYSAPAPVAQQRSAPSQPLFMTESGPSSEPGQRPGSFAPPSSGPHSSSKPQDILAAAPHLTLAKMVDDLSLSQHSGFDPAVPGMTPFEQELIMEVNLARSSPSTFALYLLNERRPYFNGTVLQMPNAVSKTSNGVAIQALQTKEGVRALDEAVAFLNTVAPVQQLVPLDGMCYAARHELCHSQAGYQPSNTIMRIKAMMNVHGDVIELLNYGRGTARELVARMIICDGDTNRSQRSVLYDPQYDCIGAGYGVNQQNGRQLMIIALGYNVFAGHHD